MFCRECKTRESCKALCKEIKKHLTDNGIYRADYIRPRLTGGKGYREIPFTSLNKKGQKALKKRGLV